jgi:hypothetical protein
MRAAAAGRAVTTVQTQDTLQDNIGGGGGGGDGSGDVWDGKTMQ